MTSAELKYELQRAGIGHIEAAKLLSVHPTNMLAWMDGAEIPAEIAQKVLKLPTRKPRQP